MLRYRQIHLDFHTSEHIPDVGADFDPERFVATLKAAHVDSVTCFSRCHHGWIYHETKLPYRHPNLKCDLLTEQIRACHAADIRVPIYITVGWDHLQARLHPEWVQIDAEGKVAGRGPLDDQAWTFMDFASEYVDFVVEQTEEVLDLYGDEVDGFFFDIMHQRAVHSAACLARFEKEGWDPNDVDAQSRMRRLLVDECAARLFDTVRAKSKRATVFFNGGHIDPAFRSRLASYTHLEVESLPTGGWGYAHFPITARYARTLNSDFMGMTGRFSEMWGHFNSYKARAALDFECLQSVGLGGRCSVGDQLHPSGVLDQEAYALIGHTYAKVEAMQPWFETAEPVVEIGVFNAEADEPAEHRLHPSNVGVMRTLVEGQYQFDFVDAKTDLSRYRLLILPDVIRVDEALAQKLAAFDGVILTTGRSGFDGATIPGFPATSTEALPYSPDFVKADPKLMDRGDSAFVMYDRGRALEPTEGAEILGTVSEPYFERDWKRFCSHAHTPLAEHTSKPAALRKGKYLCLAHPVFQTYADHGMVFHRDLALAAIQSLMPDPILRFRGAKSVQANVAKNGESINVLLLHYIPERRGRIDVVEDPMLIGEGPLSIRSEVPLQAHLQPVGRELPTGFQDGYVTLALPSDLAGHALIELSPK